MLKPCSFLFLQIGGSFYRGLGLCFLRGLGLIEGRFRVDPSGNHMAVGLNWGVLLVGVLRIRALLFGVSITAPDFWKLLFWEAPEHPSGGRPTWKQPSSEACCGT